MSCLTCAHFIEVIEECDLAPKMRPPARVIAYGCPSWKNTNDKDLEHHVRSGNLSFSAKPVPAPASKPAFVQSFKSPVAKNLADWDDDIPF